MKIKFHFVLYVLKANKLRLQSLLFENKRKVIDLVCTGIASISIISGNA